MSEITVESYDLSGSKEMIKTVKNILTDLKADYLTFGAGPNGEIDIRVQKGIHRSIIKINEGDDEERSIKNLLETFHSYLKNREHD